MSTVPTSFGPDASGPASFGSAALAQMLSGAVLASIDTFHVVFDETPCVAMGTAVRAEATLILDTGDAMRVRVMMPFAAYSMIAYITSDENDIEPLTADEVFAIEARGDLDAETGDFDLLEVITSERLWRGHDGRLHAYA